jgi:amino acid exporter
MDDITLYLPGIILAYSAFLVAIASPGPNVLAVIGTSMDVGRGPGLGLALGIGAGAFSWAALTLAGLSTLLIAYASALVAIKIFGGCYLLWLAYKAFKSAASNVDPQAREFAGRRSRRGYFLKGYVVCMTNPKAVLAWVAIISLGLKPGAPLWVGIVIISGTSVLSVAIHCLYAIMFSTPVAARIYLGCRRYIQMTLGVFFAAAGARLLGSQS